MEIFIDLGVLKKLIQESIDTYDSYSNSAEDFEGFLVGMISENRLNIKDIKIKRGNSDFNDFGMQMALIEDEIYSEGGNNYLVGFFRTHNGLGENPSPGDLSDLSNLQSINPNAVLLIFDVLNCKNTTNTGIKFFQLSNSIDPNSNIISLNWNVSNGTEGALNEYIANLPTNQLNFAQIDALVNKALVNIQTNAFEDSLKFLFEARSRIGTKKDSELAEKVECTILEIYFRQGEYKKVLQGIEKIKNEYSGAQSDNLLGLLAMLLGRVLIKFNKIEAGIKAFEEAAKYFDNSQNWIKKAQTYVLWALTELPRNGAEETLKILFQGLSAVSHLRSDHDKDNLINKLGLEKNTKELIQTLDDNAKQQKYIDMLNEIRDAHGYKIVLEDF